METNRHRAKPSPLGILLRLMAFVLILAAILFIAAGRWDWAMGWIYMAVYACVTVIGVLVVPLDPGLVEERTRIKEGVKEWDKRITVIGSVLYPLTILIVAGLDTRFGWSPRIPPILQVAALVAVAVGNLISIWAKAVNRFYSRLVRIQRERGHSVISDGPYRYVRHPGYLGRLSSMVNWETGTPVNWFPVYQFANLPVRGGKHGVLRANRKEVQRPGLQARPGGG